LVGVSERLATPLLKLTKLHHPARSCRPVVPFDSFMKVYYGQTAILCWNICSRWYSKQRWRQGLKRMDDVKISDVRVTRISMPRVDPAWRTASYAGSAVEGFIFEVEADGATGIGGTAAHPSNISGDKLEAELNGPVRAALLGADPLDANAIRGTMRTANLHTRSFIAADLALYDLAGKLANLPCFALWGGRVRSQLKIVRMVGIKAPAELEGAVGALVDQRITHMKVKVGTGIQEDVARIRALRQAFGQSIWIGIDGNGAYTVDDAIELSHALAPYDVALIEQPINYRDLDGMARLAAASAIPIMADQCVYDASSALEVCRRQAAQIVSVKATKMGSLDECRRVIEICQAFGVRAHIGGSAGPAVVDVAIGHLAATLAGVDDECEVGEYQALKGDPSLGTIVKDGNMEFATTPGWGLTLPRR
jgi:L-alanine-DL-glutamate epimerase-like enolase superfamily enzyme